LGHRKTCGIVRPPSKVTQVSTFSRFPILKRLPLAVAVVLALFAVGSPASADPIPPEAEAVDRQTYQVQNCPPGVAAMFELDAAVGNPPVATGSALETKVVTTDSDGFAQVVFTTIEPNGTYVVTAACGDLRASFGVLPTTPPTTTTTTTMPPATLPATGATNDLPTVLALAGSFVVGGSMLVLARRRRLRPGASA
jgi:LPXTG-motif cell wall-anchored protein